MLTTTTLTIIGLAIWLLGYLFIGGYLQKVYLKYKPGRPVPAVEFRDDIDFIRQPRSLVRRPLGLHSWRSSSGWWCNRCHVGDSAAFCILP